MSIHEAKIAYRAAIGKLATEASYTITQSEGIIAVYTEDPRSILEPHARVILEEIVRSAESVENLRSVGLNGYDWEYELLNTIQAESILFQAEPILDVVKQAEPILEVFQQSVDLDVVQKVYPVVSNAIQADSDVSENVVKRKSQRK